MDKITPRQTKLLKLIVKEYAYTAFPVSSQEINEKYLKDISAQTIRNDMAALEKLGLLEKTHTSSGRVPSSAGYKYYEKNILEPTIKNDIKFRLQKIFNNRDLSIDTVINQSVEILKESFKLPMIITKSEGDETLKRFDLIQIEDNTALIIIVTNNGNVIKNTISFNTPKMFNDIAICVRVFNDRLIDTPLNQLQDKIASIKEIIRNVVHEYEFCIRQIIEKIFEFNQSPIKNEIHGVNYLTTQPEFQDTNKLNQILSFLEDTNVWKHIAYNQEKIGKTSIIFGDDIGQKGLAIASTSIASTKGKQQLSIIGPARMEYAEVKGVLDFINEEINKYDK